MDIEQPLNKKVLDYLTHGGNYMYSKHNFPVFTHWNSLADPYSDCGCHPDIVERLWDHIGAALPTDCRGLVYGNPALVHSESKVILGIGLGTWYGLRLPELLVEEALKKGAETLVRLSDNNLLNIKSILGEDWVFGAFIADELDWCKKGYDILI